MFGRKEKMKVILGQSYSFCQQGERDYQEDARWPNTDLPLSSQRFFIVCDGVGGCEQGDIASATVCREMAKQLDLMDFTNEFTPTDFTKVFDAAYDALDAMVDEDNSDMATTMTFVCFHAGGCTMAHVGDSRIYQYRKNEGIIYRSDDHSLVNMMVHDGKLSPEEAESHSQRNIITRYMSPIADDEERWEATMVTTDDVMPNDIFILCTDGVGCCVTDNHLTEILNSDMTDEQKAKQIAAECIYSSDNNTCILIPVKDVVDRQCEPFNVTSSVETKKIRKLPYKTIDVESKKEKNKSFLQKIKEMFNF